MKMSSDSKNINLRKANQHDVGFIVSLENDADDNLYIGKWEYNTHLSALDNKDIAYFIIQDHLSKVGYVILTDLSNEHNSVHIKRIAICASSKGKGYGKKAFEIILAWIFQNTQAHRVWLDVKDYNSRAIHIYKSKGFIIEGTLRDYEFNAIKNEYESFHIMPILREEYERSLNKNMF
ncbi:MULTISPECIES: GNAT family N-acetyltransferase [unclassified Francisella]|uniref:GNAT family N-acetyltransferase n=1 Tax=unclassified Francisella TaxID=2610885 RepID=UPI002E36BEF0|nr:MULTISPECIES: GNAT family protein [unclassified Francisella]MED7820177.1 GNAT family protein [Francisella sp. 19S2-4]MED7830997.1 GNAT family protein [Francisella sp. 19S2-10]